MHVTLEGIVTEVKLEHPSKAKFPMFVTLEGIVIVFKYVQSLKASLPINLVPFLILYESKVLSTVSTRNISAYLMLSMTGKLVQYLKALPSMFFTLEGMVTEVRPEQPEKAPYSMLVTLEGMVIEVKS